MVRKDPSYNRIGLLRKLSARSFDSVHVGGNFAQIVGDDGDSRVDLSVDVAANHGSFFWTEANRVQAQFANLRPPRGQLCHFRSSASSVLWWIFSTTYSTMARNVSACLANQGAWARRRRQFSDEF